jgi:hypothetical protein
MLVYSCLDVVYSCLDYPHLNPVINKPLWSLKTSIKTIKTVCVFFSFLKEKEKIKKIIFFIKKVQFFSYFSAEKTRIRPYPNFTGALIVVVGW